MLATNDFHGRLLPDKPEWARGRALGGAATLASYFREERERFDGPVILLDGGDVMQGTPLSNLTGGRASVDFFDEAHYAAAAIGNHEFDWSEDTLRARMRQARFAWLSANITVAGADTAPSWLEPTRIFDVNGVRVGVIGLTTPTTPSLTRPTSVAGLAFREGPAAIDRWVPVLRRDGADFVIVVAHAGAACDTAMTHCKGEIIDWARAVRHKPDLIVAGHTHRVVRTRVNGIPIVETGAYGTRYGVVDLTRVGPDSVDARIRGTPLAWDDGVTPDSAVAALVARDQKEIGPRVDGVVTMLARPLPKGRGESAVGRMIADAERWATHSQVAIINDGGIRSDLHAGPLTWGALYQLEPFQNKLVTLKMTGRQIHAVMEKGLEDGLPSIQVSGLDVDYDPDRPAGGRVVSLRLGDGSRVRNDTVYTVAVPDFLATGKGNGFRTFGQALGRSDTGLVDLDALIGYLKTLPSPVEGPRDERFRVVAAQPGGAP